MWTTIGARLLNLFLRNLVCVGTLKSFRFLVGGGWNNGSAGGLWCWNCWSVSTGTNINIGARLIIWELMCKSSTFTFFLVGGGCSEHFEAGLWFCRVHGSSTASWVSVGARLLIYREMMCKSAVILPIILSAVDMVLAYRLACGVGL